MENLYVPDEVVSVYSHVDRMITLGCMPVREVVPLEKGLDVYAALGVDFFLERRELGLFNLGGSGVVSVDGVRYPLESRDCLYIAKGAKEVLFHSDDAQNPAKFYMVSAPAHCSYETRRLTYADAVKRPMGSAETSNKRTICQFIHPSVLKTCQLSMGMTMLEPGSVWNTMPAHTHERRMEIYTYFDIPEGNVVFHFMGESNQTRHVVMHNGQAGDQPVLEHSQRRGNRQLFLYLGNGWRKPGLRRYGQPIHHGFALTAARSRTKGTQDGAIGTRC